VSVLVPAEYDRPGFETSAGRVLPGVEVKIRREDETPAAPGEPSRIEVRSPAAAQGFCNRPDLDAETFRDGWCRSGDLGFLDSEGRLHILGRRADIVIDGSGRLVCPAQIEETLCNLPCVRYPVVIPDPGTDRCSLPWSADRVRTLTARPSGKPWQWRTVPPSPPASPISISRPFPLPNRRSPIARRSARSGGRFRRHRAHGLRLRDRVR
jgi:acyl-CoA synthetase (AMP-forming)/AMP-acid ligase II